MGYDNIDLYYVLLIFPTFPFTHFQLVVNHVRMGGPGMMELVLVSALRPTVAIAVKVS